MSTRPRHPRFVPLLLLLLAACGPGRAAAPSDGPADEERVQTGYGSERRGTSTASVSSLSGEGMPDRSGATLAELLGRVPGVEVRRMDGAEFSVRIRGSRSIGLSNEPLFVVDGVPRTHTALEAIAPSSVVRIDVLKDAGSLAAYGARGANGVILITTLDAP
jgi:TonB-dependent SusC/RagA subfamily outer membrane receptor